MMASSAGGSFTSGRRDRRPVTSSNLVAKRSHVAIELGDAARVVRAPAHGYSAVEDGEVRVVIPLVCDHGYGDRVGDPIAISRKAKRFFQGARLLRRRGGRR